MQENEALDAIIAEVEVERVVEEGEDVESEELEDHNAH